MPTILIENLTAKYINTKKDEVIALQNLSCKFEDGKFSVIVGYSGCGKTTLLRTILGTQQYDGQIFIDGKNANCFDVSKRNFAYVSQNYALYPHMTIFDNIAFPLKIIHAPREEIINRVKEIAELLDLTTTLSRKPKHLSGGQQQRVAIARALIKRPSVCLFDEPLSNLDAKARMEIRYTIRKIVDSFNTTVIYVTHNFTEALALADTIYVLNNKKIEIFGKPKDLLNSDNETVNSLKNNGEFYN